MAVPGSGILSMKAMAQEALYGTYGSGTITGSIGLYALVNGGNQNSGNTYPAVNQNCLPNPANRSSLEQALLLLWVAEAQLITIIHILVMQVIWLLVIKCLQMLL